MVPSDLAHPGEVVKDQDLQDYVGLTLCSAMLQLSGLHRSYHLSEWGALFVGSK